MADWLSSMQQSFEYYVVDPITWKDTRLLDNVKKCTITLDSAAETLGSASIKITESVGECYIRIYLVTVQNGVKERHPLGTFIVQTPASSFNGRVRDVTMDAYTPLIELKENPPPIGYYVPKTNNIIELAHILAKENMRGPVVAVKKSSVETDRSNMKLHNDFVAGTNDTWLSFLTNLIANAKYRFALDEMGRTLFAPVQKTSMLQPIWTYNDDNSSILYSDISMNHDLYGIPNVVEVIYSSENGETFDVVVKNEDENSPTSVINRGREIMHRVINPSELVGVPSKTQVQDYAEKLLEELSTVEYSLSYTHAYCPVRVGDCVRLNYTRSGITNIKAKVVSQSIECVPGCPVNETAVFTVNLMKPEVYWR